MSLLISESELDSRVSRAEIVYHRLGQGSGNEPRPRGENFRSGIPHFVREVIAGEARAELGTHRDIGKAWGLSDTTVKNIEDARVGRHELRGVDSDLDVSAGEVAQIMEDVIVVKTNEKILHTIVSMDDNAIASEKPIAQSVIARNLANILDRLKPKTPAINANIQFNVFTPKEKNILEFGEPIRVIEGKR